MGYKCTVCDEIHEGLPDIAAAKPDYWFGVPAEERERRTALTEDTCIIDDEDFFIRGVLEIPIHDYPHRFGFGVWVSQKREHFYTYLENFDTDQIGPFFGWLSTKIHYYGDDTLSLKTMAHFRGGSQRPAIELETTDHPLAVAQREGITLAQAWDIVHFYMQGGVQDGGETVH
jgi:hypothetical protein